MAFIVPFVLLFGVLFLMSRSEKKKRAQLEGKLKKGDRVLTRSGIKGKLIDVQEGNVKVEIAPGVHVSMVKAAVEGLDPGDAIRSGDKGGKSKDGKGGKDDPKAPDKKKKK